MATSTRREFKAEASQMVVQNDRPIAQATKELQNNHGVLGKRVKLYREKPGASPAGFKRGVCGVS